MADKINPSGKTDNRGRIVDPHTGAPLRDKDRRTYGTAPFMGRGEGKPDRKKERRLARRIEGFEGTVKRNLFKHEVHRPGSGKSGK